jgi:hypothetical protein
MVKRLVKLWLFSGAERLEADLYFTFIDGENRPIAVLLVLRSDSRHEPTRRTPTGGSESSVFYSPAT